MIDEKQLGIYIGFTAILLSCHVTRACWRNGSAFVSNPDFFILHHILTYVVSPPTRRYRERLSVRVRRRSFFLPFQTLFLL